MTTQHNLEKRTRGYVCLCSWAASSLQSPRPPTAVSHVELKDLDALGSTPRCVDYAGPAYTDGQLGATRGGKWTACGLLCHFVACQWRPLLQAVCLEAPANNGHAALPSRTQPRETIHVDTPTECFLQNPTGWTGWCRQRVTRALAEATGSTVAR